MEPRILLYDIETAPNLAYVWGKYEQDVIAYESEWYMMTFSYKWLGEKRVIARGLPDYPLYKKQPENDKALVSELHKLFSDADVVIAHNGDAFDQKKSQARMIYHGLTPPAPYKQIDTKKVARKYFNFNSNKLDDLGKLLGCGQKLDTGGFELWLGCMNGNISAWNKMKRYNKQDVVLLEEVYLKMRPWIVNHPSMALMLDRPEVCPKCGEGPLIISKKRKIAKTGFAIQYQCKACGGYSTDRKNQKTQVQFVN